MTKDELHKSVNPGQLMQALEWDFANIRIEIADSDLQKLSFGDAKMWPAELMQALKDRRVPLQSSQGDGTDFIPWAASKRRSITCFRLQTAQKDAGNTATIGQPAGTGKGMARCFCWLGMALWNRGVEFQIDFDNKEGEYLVLEYEFSNSVLDVLSQFPAESMKAMTHILCPALSAAMLRRGEEGLPFKIDREKQESYPSRKMTGKAEQPSLRLLPSVSDYFAFCSLKISQNL